MSRPRGSQPFGTAALGERCHEGRWEVETLRPRSRLTPQPWRGSHGSAGVLLAGSWVVVLFSEHEARTPQGEWDALAPTLPCLHLLGAGGDREHPAAALQAQGNPPSDQGLPAAGLRAGEKPTTPIAWLLPLAALQRGGAAVLWLPAKGWYQRQGRPACLHGS